MPSSTRFMYNNLFDLSTLTLTVSSEESGFPKENLQHIWPSRPWRTTGTADEWVKVDFGAATGITAFIAETHDIPSGATLNIQAHASDAWGAPTVNVALTWTVDKLIKFWSSPQSFRWWRFRMQGGGGAGYRSIGRIFLGTYFETAVNFRHRGITHIDPSTIIKSSGGQPSADKKTHFSKREYLFRLTSDAEIASLETIFSTVGQAEPYFLCETPDSDPDTTLYYVRNTAPWPFQQVAITPYIDLSIAVETMR